MIVLSLSPSLSLPPSLSLSLSLPPPPPITTVSVNYAYKIDMTLMNKSYFFSLFPFCEHPVNFMKGRKLLWVVLEGGGEELRGKFETNTQQTASAPILLFHL